MVEITPSGREATFTILLEDDEDFEEDETFTVTISETSTLPEGVMIDDDNKSSTATIIDNDEMPTIGVSIADAIPVAEGGTAAFRVTLSQAVSSNVVLNVTYATRTADPATDLRPDPPATVTIDANATEATLNVPIIDDNVVEGDETFTVTISGNTLPREVGIVGGRATGTITDNDEALVSLAPARLTVAEDGSFAYTINLSAPAGVAVGIIWTATDGTATVEEDLKSSTGTVNITPGSREATFTILPEDDDDVEGDETFTVTISETRNLLEGVMIDRLNNRSRATITDNDGMGVAIADATPVAEGGTATFRVTLSPAVSSSVVLSVAYAADTADPAMDLGIDRPVTVTIDANATEATLNVPILDDDVVEGDETFTVTLSGDILPEGVGIIDGQATGTITDNDRALVSLTPAMLTEAENGSFSYTVNLSAPADAAVGITWTATDGTAMVDEDLRSSTGMLEIAAGGREATFTILPEDDDDFEEDETFTVTISETSTLPGGVMIDDANKSSTATITDNDLEATVSIADATPVAEDGTAIFTVTLSPAVSSSVVLNVAYAARTADPATDLQADRPVTVTIDADATEATLNVPIIDDDVAEGDETFTVTLTGNTLPMGVSVGSGEATGTITDNDEALVSLDPTTLTAAEDGSFDYTVSLSAPADSAVGITWTATDGTAAVGEDLQSATGTVEIAAGGREATFTILPEDDEDFEEDETFTVTISETSTLPGGVMIDDANKSSTATITDNDLEATVSIADATPVAEGGTAMFTVTLSPAVSSSVVLNVGYVAGTADPATDLGTRPATVTIDAGATEATLGVPIIDDEIVEGEETFMVTITGNTLPDGVSIGDGQATGTIERSFGPSVLIEPRRIGAGAALRRHVSRFDRMTGTVIRNRLKGSGMQDLFLSVNVAGDHQDMAVSSQQGEHRWGSWIDGAYASIGGNAAGRQTDIYGGVDYLDNDWMIGALIGYEFGDLEIDEATYSAGYIHFGFYGGARLSERLLFDGATTYGLATPEIGQGDVSASYDAQRFTVRGALTGNFGLKYGSIRVEPRFGLLYSSETLGDFIDTAGGIAEQEVLDIGRFSVGPRLMSDFDSGQLVGGARVQWDFLQLNDGVGGRVSGAADVGVQLSLAPGINLGLFGDVDGLGIMDDFRSFGGRIEFNARF